MLIKIKAKGASDLSSDIGEYDVIKNRLRLFYSVAYMPNDENEFYIKDFDFPANCSKIELVDNGALETLAVPVSVFKDSYEVGKGYKVNYRDWKKQYLKRF